MPNTLINSLFYLCLPQSHLPPISVPLLLIRNAISMSFSHSFPFPYVDFLTLRLFIQLLPSESFYMEELYLLFYLSSSYNCFPLSLEPPRDSGSGFYVDPPAKAVKHLSHLPLSLFSFLMSLLSGWLV